MNKFKMLAALPIVAAAVTIAVLGASPASARATATATATAASAIPGTTTVTGTGWTPGAVFLVECGKNTADGSGCNKSAITPATADASGKFSQKVSLKGGATGCSASSCYVLATTATQTPSVFAKVTVGGGASSSAPASSAPASSAASSTAAAAPTAVNAGSGGHAGSEGVPAGVIVLAGIGALGLGVGVRRFARQH